MEINIFSKFRYIIVQIYGSGEIRYVGLMATNTSTLTWMFYNRLKSTNAY